MPETGSTETLTPPAIQWAQRKHLVFMTVCLEDCKNPTIKMETDKLYFKGKGGTDNKEHEVTLNFFKDIVPEDSREFIRDRTIDFIFKKKDDGPFWKRLLKDDKKYHWLKVDFNKWKDEDDSDDDLGMTPDLEDVMKQMGGLGGAGEKPSLEDLDADNEDSDDEDLPDLE